MYCTVEDIEALLNSQYFEKHLKPSRDILTRIAEQVTASIDGVLILHGYTYPVTNATLKSLLSSINSAGVAAILVARDHPADVRPDNVFDKRYKEGIAMIKDRRYIAYINLDQTEDERKW